MARRIFKYPIELSTISLEMPAEAEILDVAWQPGTGICLWALVDPEAAKVQYSVHVIGTGWEVSDDLLEEHGYVGTAHAPGYVWHIFMGESPI